MFFEQEQRNDANDNRDEHVGKVQREPAEDSRQGGKKVKVPVCRHVECLEKQKSLQLQSDIS